MRPFILTHPITVSALRRFVDGSFLSGMEHSKLTSSKRHQRNKRVRMPKSGVEPRTMAPPLEPGAPSDFELMKGIQTGDADALSQLYDRYNGILKALILRVIHNEA